MRPFLAVPIFFLLSSSVVVAAAPPAGAPVAGEVLVKIKTGATPEDVAGLEKAGDIERSERLAQVRNGAIWRMKSRSRNTEALAEALARNPRVEYAEPNYVIRTTATPNDPSYHEMWALRNVLASTDISAESAWNVTTGSKDIVVGVVDTGIDYHHPDLAANMWRNPGGKGNAACAAGTFGYNAFTRSCDPMDDHGHGTHVAGTIGAASNNGLGITGINWNTSIMALKSLSANGAGTTAGAIEVIEFAIQAKIDGVNLRVLSNSWGGGGFSKALLDVINKANEHDILFVAAAGNDTQDTDWAPHYPSSYATPNMISVAATDRFDDLASFSNYGATTVHLSAPGVHILSARIGGLYGLSSGTSMACPHVSGVAALVLAKNPAWTTAQVRAAILDNVDPVPALTGKTVTGGRLNAAKALGAPPIPRYTIAVAPTVQQMTRNASASYTITINPTNGFTAPVELSVTGLPAGATATFTPASATKTSTMTVTTANAPIGWHQLVVTGTSGAFSRSVHAVASVSAVVPPPPACPSFAPTVDYDARTPSAVATADFNADGELDVVAVTLNTNSVSVFLGDVNGALRFPAIYRAGTAPMSVITGDFNGDGRADIAVANSGASTVSILTGHGDGTFAPAVHYQTGTSPFTVAAADFDGDGRTDLVTANNGASSVSILKGAGDGTFGPPVHYTAASGPYWVSVADLDRDGDADLAVPAFNANRLAVLLNKGDGTFAPAVLYDTTGIKPSSVAVADFNRDGVPDLAVSNHGSSFLSVFSGNGDGSFGEPAKVMGDSNISFVLAADFSGDGAADLLAANADYGVLMMHAGNGNGTFGVPAGMRVAVQPYHLAAADLNGDGRDDVVIADMIDRVRVLMNNSACTFNCGTFTPGGTLAGASATAVAAGDFNRDGRSDLAVVAGGEVSIRTGSGDGSFAAGATVAANAQSVTAGDFNRDGRPDLAVAGEGVSIHHGNGDGTFQTALTRAAGTNPRAIAAADFNRDGRLDLAVANAGSNDVSILIGESVATFAAGTSPSSIAAGDLDGDGRIDLAVANSGSHDITILRGNGDGTFGSAASYGAGTSPSSIAAADFNGDGALDLAVANSGDGNAGVYFGNGDGTFQLPVRFATGTAPSHLLATDLTADGAIDLAVANRGSNDVVLLAGDGRGSFAAAVSTAAGTAPAALAAADFDRDGKPELAAANGGGIAILRNTCPTPDLTIAKTHSGNFAQGSSGVYTITVTNAGAGATKNAVTVSDILPDGLRATAIGGTGWNCDLGSLTCTRADALAAGASYPPITVNVRIGALAAASVTNQATVSGGGDLNTANNTASDVTAITAVSDLTVSMTHGGSFAQGATGRTYTLVVKNAGGTATSGTVTVSSTLPASLTVTAMSGTGWSCTPGSLTCTRNDALAAGGSYPAITITVNVAADAPSEVLATATVSGGGQTNTGNDTASDPAFIWSTAQACGGFGTAVRYETGTSPSAIVSGDFNGDGRRDLAAANHYSQTVSILLGNGDGTFAKAVTYTAGAGPRSLAAGDLDGDGKLDLVTANEYSDDLSIFFGNGNGTFAAAVSLPAGDGHSVAIADFNNDNAADLVVSNLYGSTISVLLGRGEGLFEPRVTYAAPMQSAIGALLVADFDGDTKPDVVAVNESGGGVWRFPGKGDGTFLAAVRHATTTSSAHAAAGDFNADGRLDLAVSNPNTQNLSVLLGAGGGSFQAPVNYSLSFGIGFVRAVDLNGDGRSDLMVGATNGGVIYQLRGNGDGTFQPQTSIPSPGASQFLVADFDADGRPDIAMSIAYSSGVGVLLAGCADLTLTKTHAGNFNAGQQHTYTITVKNSGNGSSQGTVTLVDELPEGLSIVSMSGAGWTCDPAKATCTRTDPRAAGASYTPLMVTVLVARTAPSSLTNTARVSGGGDVNADNNVATDPTAIVHGPDLKITVAHTGNFAQGQNGTYTITAGNVGSAATSGAVTVTATLPTGMTATAMSGTGWSCTVASRTCTREDSLAIDANHPPITLTVSVAGNAQTSLYTSAAVSGGGDINTFNNSGGDWTNVLATPTNLTASLAAGPQVNLTWTASFNATSYRVLRSTIGTGPYTLIGSPLSNSFIDTTVAAGTTYFYRVTAADATTVGSESNTATIAIPGAAVKFTDDPLVSGTTVKAVHITELRAAIDAMRARAALPAFSFTDESLAAGMWIKATHLIELRTALDGARAALGMPALVHTDAGPVIIRAVHIQELRAGVTTR